MDRSAAAQSSGASAGPSGQRGQNADRHPYTGSKEKRTSPIAWRNPLDAIYISIAGAAGIFPQAVLPEPGVINQVQAALFYIGKVFSDRTCSKDHKFG